MSTNTTMNKVLLIIIYNHQYNQNIEVLERIYKDKFSDIYHIVPFYNGVKSNVIAVYENSYYFQGYVAQGLKIFFKQTYEHYFFIADDLILNPAINQHNYSNYFNLDQETCFLSEFISLHKRKMWWSQTGKAYRWNVKIAGVEATNQLPDYEIALQKLQSFGLTIKPLRYNQICENCPQHRIRNFVKYFLRYRKLGPFKQYHLQYPMIGSYSDIFIINSKSIKQFSHFCGDLLQQNYL